MTTAVALSSCDLERELRLAQLSRALRSCIKPNDHLARRVAYARAGFRDVIVRDDIAAHRLHQQRAEALQGAAA